ncbi:MAG: hypothetical protein R3C56_35845 [Pirellulaceae bacterium]
MSQIVIRHLRPHFENAPCPSWSYAFDSTVRTMLAVVLSAVICGSSNQQAQQAFEAAASQLSGLGLKLVLRSDQQQQNAKPTRLCFSGTADG